jgi:type I restriction enzyme M protein
MNLPVPAEIILDEKVNDLLDDVHTGRRVLREATSGILPNVFSSAETDVEGFLNDTRSAAAEARLISELVRPLEDPVWRAERSYPFHVAALARRYRVRTHPAERKDALLKLAEGIARTVGILALTELVAKDGFTRRLRQQFRNGASFGTWLWLINSLAEEIQAPRIPELSGLRGGSDLYSLLESIKDLRNGSHHAHGVRASHELKEQVDQLEPPVVSALKAVTWFSSTHWDWVERCEYLDESSYRLVGQRLRGSHPHWEPFERSSTFPLQPDRIYVDSSPSEKPMDLWPLASVSLCANCNARELFLIDEVRDGVLTLRSLEEHSMEVSYTSPE